MLPFLARLKVLEDDQIFRKIADQSDVMRDEEKGGLRTFLILPAAA